MTLSGGNIFRSIFFFIIAMFLLQGCDQVLNSENNDNTNSNEHSSNITSDETWKKDQTHYISGYITIRNATLTIEPGATVIFKSDAGIVVSTGGGLIADGTQGIITFTAEKKQAGYWDYIQFSDDANNANSILKNCVIEYGGGYSTSGAMLYIENGATISNCTIQNSAASGVQISYNASPTFVNNTITQNGNVPIKGEFATIGYIGKGNYTGNGTDVIEIHSGKLTHNATIYKQTVPYRLDGYCRVENANLQIEAGATIEMNSESALLIKTNSGILADGTTEPITITGAVKQNGYWDYIQIANDANSANCVLKKVTVEYGGGYSTSGAMFYVANNATIQNCTFRYSKNYGVKIENSGRPVLTDNTITANEKAPVKLDFTAISALGSGAYIGNTWDYIEVNGNVLQENATLPKLAIPYRFDGYCRVENATLTITPGVVIEFNNSSALLIKTNGALWAVGTDTDSILFTGANKQSGAWDHFAIENDANVAASKVSKCIFEYGGGYSSSGAMIYLYKTSATLNNSHIQYSNSWGIIYDQNSTPDLSNNTYNDNKLGNVKVNW